MELGAPKIPPKIHLQYKARFSEESASQASHESPRNFQYTPVFQRSLYSSSTQSRSKANCAGAELAQTTEGIHSFVSRTRGTHLGDQDKHCFRNSKLSDLRDPEKSYCEDAESMARSRSTLNSPHIAITYTSHLEFSDGRYTEDRTLWILVYLSFLSPLLTLAICIYTVLLTPILLILSPLSFCTSFASFSTHIHRFLSPPLRLQLNLISSATGCTETATTNPTMLILVHILSPVIALGIAVSAWVAAVFWAYAAILGDPDGRDGNDDGKTTVMGVRAWWERWLERGLRFEEDE